MGGVVVPPKHFTNFIVPKQHQNGIRRTARTASEKIHQQGDRLIKRRPSKGKGQASHRRKLQEDICTATRANVNACGVLFSNIGAIG